MAISTTYSLTLDVAQRTCVRTVAAKQRDVESRFVNIKLTEGGAPFIAPASAIAIINAARSADNDSKAFECVINNDGTITAPLTYWMLEYGGDVKCDVSLIGSDGTKLTTFSFALAVEEAAYSGDDISQDENYDILVDLIAQVAGALDAEKERESAEKFRVMAENGRADAEHGRIDAEQARESNELLREAGEDIRESKEAERATAESGRKLAEMERDAAESARNIAEYNRASAWASAEGIKQIVIEDVDNNKQYGYQIKIEGGKPRLYVDELTQEEE